MRGRSLKNADLEVIARSWRTGAHQYLAMAGFKKGAKAEEVAQKFLNSIRPVGDYKRPAELSSGAGNPYPLQTIQAPNLIISWREIPSFQGSGVVVHVQKHQNSL
jgi:hypothetical protein